MNERISAPQIRVVDEKGKQLGVLPLREALRLAQERGLDLIEIAPQATPPVCKIIDYGRYRFEQRKREREMAKKQRATDLKMVRFRPNIDEHDLEVKINRVTLFLRQGRKVRCMVWFRGREMAHTDRGAGLLNTVATRCGEIATMETPPKMEGRNMVMTMAPKGGRSSAKDEDQQSRRKAVQTDRPGQTPPPANRPQSSADQEIRKA